MTRVYVLAFEQENNMYRVIVENETVDANKASTFKYNLRRLPGEALAGFYRSNPTQCQNFISEDGKKIKITRGDVSRYTIEKNQKGGVRIILGEVRNAKDANDLLGYRVADKSGSVKRINLTDTLKMGMATKKNGFIPFANAILVGETQGRRAYYKSYVAEGFPVELVDVQRNSGKAKPAVIPKKAPEIEKPAERKKLSDVFTQEQMRELRACKASGVDPRVIGNPALSAKQMRVIWRAEKKGFRGRAFADPAYPVENMEFMVAELETKGNIKNMLNPKFTVEQLFEISYAYMMGVNMDKVADPNIPASKMHTMIEDEGKKIWVDFKVMEGTGEFK